MSDSLKIELFGVLTELAGKSTLLVDDVDNTALLRSSVLSKFPSFATVNFVISVNREVVMGSHAVSSGDEIAFLPPFSGG
jgi:molybdopterin converting factor small subunit